MTHSNMMPSRGDVVQMVADAFYRGRILNNAHRGDVVEIIVLSALGEEWELVGLGWHPWDLQRGSGSERVRIQVKQCAALQLWGATKKLQLQFGWKSKPPDYFAKDNPGEAIEPAGYFCDIFVFGLHLETNPDCADQLDPGQWRFLVIPVSDLAPGQQSMVLKKALNKWQPVKWSELRCKVENTIAEKMIK